MNQIYSWTEDWAKKSNIEYSALEKTESTNVYAKEIKPNLNHFHLTFAKSQTHGKGRANNKWLSEDNFDNLYCSWTIHLSSPPQPISSPLIGLAIFKAFKSQWPQLNWSLKAPNDIYLNDKKIAGILLENVAIGNSFYFVIGIGINFFNKPQLETANCLIDHTKIEQKTYQQFLDQLLIQLTEIIDSCTQTSITPDQQYHLLNALNLFPLLEENYTNVNADGSLISPNKTIHWSDL